MIRKRFNYIKKTNKIGVKKYLMPCYGGRDIYNFYRKNIRKRISSPYNINYKQHRDILDLYNKKIVDNIIKGHDVKVPSLGSLVLRKKFIPTELTLSSIYLKELPKSIDPLSDGRWKPFIKFKRKGFLQKNKNLLLYSFKAGGNFQKKLTNLLKDKNWYKRYFEV